MLPSSTTHPDLDASYRAELAINAPPDAVFDALTTPSGLAAWWTPVSGSGLAGGELRFVFRDDEPCVMQVTAAQRPSTVRWTCLGYKYVPDWAGTTLSFAIQPGASGGSLLTFVHTGLTPRLECYSDCKSGWDHFLPSLRQYVESGTGQPNGSSGDLARRAAREASNAVR
jgi:uncharacterized protein YndB with AHSA1/START domain